MNLRKRRAKRALLLLVGLLLLVAFLLVRFCYAPAFTKLAITNVQNMTSNLINEAVDETLAQGTLDYNSLVTVQRNNVGTVTAISADVYRMNCLKSEIMDILSGKIQEVRSEELGVPLGSIAFPLFCSGLGPNVPVRYVAIRSSDAEFRNAFYQAGMNQTLHQIMLKVSITVTVMLPTGTKDISVGTDIAVAQTVIVGEVPQTVITMTGENDGTER